MRSRKMRMKSKELNEEPEAKGEEWKAEEERTHT